MPDVDEPDFDLKVAQLLHADAYEEDGYIWVGEKYTSPFVPKRFVFSPISNGSCVGFMDWIRNKPHKVFHRLAIMVLENKQVSINEITYQCVLSILREED